MLFLPFLDEPLSGLGLDGGAVAGINHWSLLEVGVLHHRPISPFEASAQVYVSKPELGGSGGIPDQIVDERLLFFAVDGC